MAFLAEQEKVQMMLAARVPARADGAAQGYALRVTDSATDNRLPDQHLHNSYCSQVMRPESGDFGV